MYQIAESGSGSIILQTLTQHQSIGMLKFAGISGSDQLVILNKSDTLQNEAASGKDSNKWSKQRKELFSEMPKIQVTPQRLYSSHLNKLTILETNKSIFDKIMSPNLDSPDLNPEKVLFCSLIIENENRMQTTLFQHLICVIAIMF